MQVRYTILAIAVLVSCGDGKTTAVAMIDMTKIKPLVAAELSRLRASTTTELVAGTPKRALGEGVWSTLPYSNGSAGWVAIVLVPDRYKVPTEIGLRFSFSVDPTGATVVAQSPDRADLVAAATMAIDGETRAVEAASAALEATGAKAPGRSWADSLRVIRLDPRLPAATFGGAGAPASWQLIYDQESAPGISRGVILSLPGFGVTMAK